MWEGRGTAASREYFLFVVVASVETGQPLQVGALPDEFHQSFLADVEVATASTGVDVLEVDHRVKRFHHRPEAPVARVLVFFVRHAGRAVALVREEVLVEASSSWVGRLRHGFL